MPVSGSDIKNAVNPDTLQQVAQQQGMSPDQLSQQVAEALPDMVDQATPEGQVPKQGSGLDRPAGQAASVTDSSHMITCVSPGKY